MLPNEIIIHELPKIYPYYKTYYRKILIIYHDVVEYITKNNITINEYEDYPVIQLKKERLQEARNDIVNEIVQDYKQQADKDGLELNSDNYREEVLEDITFRDITPGSTNISFEVWTKRRLVKNK